MINNYFEKLLIIENILFKYKMRVSQNKNSINFKTVNIKIKAILRHPQFYLSSFLNL